MLYNVSFSLYAVTLTPYISLRTQSVGNLGNFNHKVRRFLFVLVLLSRASTT
jgi:uncharacterized membrane protein (DUF373 family)